MFLSAVKKPLEEPASPVLTIVLSVILIGVWVLTMMLDNKALETAHQYYQSSMLARLEVPQFNASYTAQQIDASSVSRQQWLDIQANPLFIQKLDTNQIITPSNREYPAWKNAHERHTQLMGKVVAWEYGFVSSKPTVVTSLSHVFLHPSWSLLLLNIFFLLLFGSMFEGLFGQSVFVGYVVVTGVVVSWFGATVFGHSLLPYMGITGVLAALAAFIVCCYGKRHLKTLLPRLPSLPAWHYGLAWLLLTLAVMQIQPMFNSNPVMLVGGFLIGSLFGIFAKNFLIDTEDELEPLVDPGVTSDQAEKMFKLDLQEAVAFSKAGKFADALPLLQKLERQNPSDHEVAYRIHQCNRRDSSNEEYHQYSLKVMQFQARDDRVHEFVRDTFTHYIQNARPSRLNKTMIVSLADRFIRVGNLNEAEYLVKVLLKKPPISDEVMQLIEKLANLLAADGQEKKARVYRMGLNKVLSDNAPVDTMILDSYREL